MKKQPKHVHTHLLNIIRYIALPTSALIAIASCKEIPDVVEITHQRELSKYDENEALRAALNRFKAIQPIHWRRVAGTQNRLLNYKVKEQTEVALGSFSGTIDSNIARWYGQYKLTFNPAELESMQHGNMLDNKPYYLVDITGTFETSMGGPLIKNENWSTIGIICDIGAGQIITIKMTGPAVETAKEKENLIQYAKDRK